MAAGGCADLFASVKKKFFAAIVLVVSGLLTNETNEAVQLNNQLYGSLTIAVVPKAPSFDSEDPSSNSPTRSPRVMRVSVPNTSRANLLAVSTGVQRWA